MQSIYGYMRSKRETVREKRRGQDQDQDIYPDTMELERSRVHTEALNRQKNAFDRPDEGLNRTQSVFDRTAIFHTNDDLN